MTFEDIPEESSVTLTESERQIVVLICAGASHNEIAGTLNITDGMLKTYLHSIYQKLAAVNRSSLAAWVRRP